MATSVMGLPPGATVEPLTQQAAPQIEGLPAGATVDPIAQTPPAPPAPAQPKSPTLSNSQGASLPEQIAGSLGDVGVGVAKQAGSTVNGLGQLIHHIIGVGIPDESKHLEQNTPEQKVGGGMETVGEFAAGDGALKGLSLVERLGLAGKVAKIAQDSPGIGKVLEAGFAAMRQGAVGTALGLAHGDSPEDAGKQGLAAGAVGGVLHAAASGIAGLDPAGRAAALYEKMMAPTTKVDKAATTATAPRLIKDIGFTKSMGSLREKVASYLSEAEGNLSKTEDALPVGQKVNTGAAVDSLRNLADSTNVDADPNAPMKRVLHTSSLLDEYGKPFITSEDLPNAASVADPSGHSTALRSTATTLADHIAKIDPSIKNVIAQRRILDDGLAGVYKGADPAVNGNVQAQKHAADVLRAQIAESSPEMAHANGEYSFWRKVDDVLEHTTQRRAGQSGGLLNMAAAGEAGVHLAAGNPVGAVKAFGGIKAAKGLISSVPGLTGRAAVLNALATAVGSGDVPTAARGLANSVGAAAAAKFVRLSQEDLKPKR